jgi:hypothetical protein
MDTKAMTNIVKNAVKSVEKNRPQIFTFLGIAGLVGAGVLAVKQTPKALRLIEEKKKEENKENLTVVETIKTTWKCYVPAATTAIVSGSLIVAASAENIKRNTVLSAAYALSQSAIKEYQEKVVETFGEKKEREVRESIARDKVEKNPLVNNEVIITEKGNSLCYDIFAGRYFKSDIDKIKKSVNDLNKSLMNENYISLNDFYYELGLSPTKLGNELGWNSSDKLIEVAFSSTLAKDGTPCIVLDYKIAPKWDYCNLYG